MKLSMEHSNVIPVAGSPALPRSERSMGTILVHAGRLTSESTERIMQLQRDEGLRFGDAAVRLGLLTPADIELALARQFDYPYLISGESQVSDQVTSAYTPFSAGSKAVSALRSELMLRWFNPSDGGIALAVVSADRGEGRSFLAANLAVAFSQLGRKTLLIDADMRNPTQHAGFGIDNRSGLAAMLSGRSALEAAIHRIPGLPGLSVLPAGAQPPNPLELLERPIFAQLLAELSLDFEVILLDSPAAAECPDAQGIAARAGAALVVARRGASRMAHVRDAAETVTHAGAIVVGTVLNDF
jgi:receptor protein-tyrosine kinase